MLQIVQLPLFFVCMVTYFWVEEESKILSSSSELLVIIKASDLVYLAEQYWDHKISGNQKPDILIHVCLENQSGFIFPKGAPSAYRKILLKIQYSNQGWFVLWILDDQLHYSFSKYPKFMNCLATLDLQFSFGLLQFLCFVQHES